MFFQFLYFLLANSLRGWTNKIRVGYAAPLPSDAPLLIACTHPNSALDYLFLPVVTRRKAFVLVRGDVFRRKTLNAIFRTIWMMPVYRLRDGFSTLAKNEESFKECFKLFNRNGRVLIFSEGNCVQKKEIQPIRKGTARLALDYQSQQPNKTLYVVPMANNYTHFRRFRFSSYTRFGEPIAVDRYLPLLAENENKAYIALTEEIERALSQLFITVPNFDDNCLTEKALAALRFKATEGDEWMEENSDDFNREQKLVNALTNGAQLPVDFEKRFDALKKPHLLTGQLNQPISTLGRLFTLAVAAPFLLLAAAMLVWPVWLCQWLVRKKIKDIIFHDSVMVFGAPVFFLIQHILITALLLAMLDGYAALAISAGLAAAVVVAIDLAGPAITAWRSNYATRMRSELEYLHGVVSPLAG